MKTIILLTFLTASVLFAEVDHVASDKFFRALAKAESGGLSYPSATNDGRIGLYRISYEYWKEAVEFDSELKGTFDDCASEVYARKVVNAYLRKHAASALEHKTYEVLAKTHKFGPFWKSQSHEADIYWNDFKKNLTLYWY